MDADTIDRDNLEQHLGGIGDDIAGKVKDIL